MAMESTQNIRLGVLAVLFTAFIQCVGYSQTGYATPSALTESTRSLLLQLDSVLTQVPVFDKAKEAELNRMRTQKPAPTASPNALYNYYLQLGQAYANYKADSALLYVNKALTVSEQAHLLKEQKSIATIRKADLLSKLGLYWEALALLKTLGTDSLPQQQKEDYYHTYSDLYRFCAEYAERGSYQQKYLQLANAYTDSLIQITTPNSYHYIYAHAYQLAQQGNLQQAIAFLRDGLEKLPQGSHEKSIAHYILSYLHHKNNNQTAELENLILSAIGDLQLSIKETTSLRLLAERMYESGDLPRAQRYMKKSMEDANFYNARLRNIQASQMLPIINKEYQMQREKHTHALQKALWGVGILGLLLLVAVVYVYCQMQRLRKTRKALEASHSDLVRLYHEQERSTVLLSEAYERLREANRIKEEYLGRYLQLSSAYIDTLAQYRHQLHQGLSAGHVREVSAQLRSPEVEQLALERFYEEFDNAFLSIFPNYIRELNTLLLPEEKYPEVLDRLTTELRILALLRMGVKDNSRIAELLRCSKSTVYTYRSKLKKKALNPDSFDEETLHIGAVK